VIIPDRRRRVGIRGIYGVRNERSKLYATRCAIPVEMTLGVSYVIVRTPERRRSVGVRGLSGDGLPS